MPNASSQRFQQTGQRAAEGATGALESAKETAQEAWHSAREGAQDIASRVSDTAYDTWDDVSSFMQRYPVATFCAGVAVGLMCAAAFWAMPSGSHRFYEMERSGRHPERPYGT
jgi:hypothetical protein